MSTEPCGNCGEPAPRPLLRTVQLRVDRAEVDKQTLCPDCFSDWIARYQEEMAETMPGSSEPETTGDDIRIAEEDESVHSHQIGDDPEEGIGESIGRSGDDIHDLGTGTGSDSNDGVDVDLDGEAAVPTDKDAEDENTDETDDALF